MKKVLLYIPIVLSFVILGAHFARYGNSIGIIGAGVLLVLLLIRQPWVARLLQVALALGVVEWLHTLYVMTQVRIALGEPYTRMGIILGTIAAVTLCSAWLFQTQTLKKHYRL